MKPLHAAAILGLALAASSAPALAQGWPSKAIKIVSPFAAGGPTDTMARPIAEHLSKALGQPVTIENRPGAGSTVGAAFVAKADPDGYTLLMGTNSGLAIGPALYAKAGYTAQSFSPVILFAEAPMVLNVSMKSGVKTIAELVAAAKAQPDAFSFASVGVATSTHLLGEMLNLQAGLKMAHVPYRGSAPAMNDLISGQIQLFFDVASASLPLAQSGNIRSILVLQDKRSPHMPEVPTSVESGFPDFRGIYWGGLVGPAGMPQPIVDRLNTEINEMLKQPDTVKLLGNITLTPMGGPPSRLADRIAQETPVWKSVGERANVKVE